MYLHESRSGSIWFMTARVPFSPNFPKTDRPHPVGRVKLSVWYWPFTFTREPPLITPRTHPFTTPLFSTPTGYTWSQQLSCCKSSLCCVSALIVTLFEHRKKANTLFLKFWVTKYVHYPNLLSELLVIYVKKLLSLKHIKVVRLKQQKSLCLIP